MNLTGKPPLGQKAGEVSKKRKEGHPLREGARGMECTLRLEGCRHSTEYTVLAHLRRFGWAGMGQKPHDLLAVFACDKCHEKQEKRSEFCTDTDILRALGETLMIQMHNGIIRVSANGRMD